MHLSQKAKKAVAAGLALSTIMWSVSLFALPAAFAAPHGEGCVVNSGGTVYLVSGSQRRGFTSAEVFASHGYNFGQVVASNSETDALPVGPIIVYAEGSLVKGPNDPLVYLVSNGQKRGFVSGSVFTGLGYSFANIQWAPVNTFQDLPTGSNVESATERHPAGTWVIDGSGTVWMMTSTGRKGLPSMEVFNSYGKSWAHVVAANAADLAAANEGVVAKRTQNCAGSVVNGNVNVSVSGPASSTLIVDTNASDPNSSQAGANLANFVFSGNGTVTSLTLKRVGVSADDIVSNIYLYDGETRLTDGGSFSSTNLTFSNASGLFTVSGSKTISVKANLNDGSYTGQTLGVQLTGVTLSSGNVGGLPVSGNLHSTAGASLATVDISGSVTASGNTNPGTDILVWQDTATVAGQNPVVMTRLALRQVENINSSDIKNFRLYIDGVQMASQQSLDSNSYVTFSGFSKSLTTGAHTIKVIADVIGGSGRNVKMSLRGAYDASFTDTQYNAGINLTTSGSFPEEPSSFTVSSGTMTVIKAADSASSNLTVGASDQSLGKFTFTAYGEPIKVETLLVDFTYDGSPGSTNNAAATLRNGRVLVNGSQVGSTTTLNPASTGTSFNTNFTVTPGTSATVEVRADLYDNDGTGTIDSGDTVSATLSAGSSNGIPQTSLTAINVPTANVSGNTLTISSASLSLAKESTYASRNVVVPQTAYKVAAFNLTNGNVEDVNVNTFTLTYTGAATFTYADLSDLYIKYGSNTSTVKSTLSGTDAFSVNYTVPKNAVVPVEVYANVLSGNVTANDTLVVNLAVTATSASGQSANVSATPGQTLTAKTAGSISNALSGSTPVAAIVSDNQTIDVASYDIITVDDGYTITDVSVSVDDATAVQSIILKDGATTLATKPGATTATFSGLNVSVPAGTTKTLTVALQLGTVGVGAGSTGASIQVAMTDATARSNSSGSNNDSFADSDIDGRAMYVYAAVPNVNRLALPTSALSTGTVTLAKFSISGNGGTVEFDELLLAVTKTAGTGEVAITSPTLWDADTNTQISATGTATTLAATDASGSISFDLTTPEQVSGTRNFLVKGTVTSSAMSTGDNVNVTFAQPSSYAASTAAGSVGATASLVWSDRSASSHSTTTSDWTNDALVKFLPLDSWTLTYN